MGDSQYLYPVALTWSEGPQRLKKLKNKFLAYFQSKAKSDGGECEIRDIDCSRGYILIHFKDKEVRDRVLQRKAHELKLPDGETLQLDVQLLEHIQNPKTSPPLQDEACKIEKNWKLQEKPTPGKEKVLPSCSSLVLLENIQDTCTDDMLNMLVENISDKSMSTDFHIERIPEIQSAVITFTCDIDTADFIGKFSSNQRVKQQKIIAKGLDESRSIRAEGIPPETSEDMVSLYFESTRNGGGSVEEVLMLSDENAVLVTFKQAEVLKSVITRQHSLNKKAIYVYPYYQSIGNCLYGKEGPHILIPDSVEIPISPHILEFIWKNKQTKINVEKAMKDVYCDIIWPNLDHPSPLIKLSLSRTQSTHLRTLAKVVPTWSNNAHKECKLVLSKYKSIECDLKPPVWEAIKGKMSSPLYDGVLIKVDLAVEKVFIAGITEDVMKIEPIFRQLVDETIRLLSRVEDEVTLEPEAYKLMLAHGLEKSVLEDSPHVKITYDGASHKIKLYGPKEEVTTAKCEILNTKQGLKLKSFQMDPYIIQFLKAVDNEELSGSLLRKNNIKAVFQVKDNIAMLIGYSDKDLTNAEETVKKELVCKRISVEDIRVTQVPEWKNLKSFLKEKLNAEGMKVFIEEFPVRETSEVVITGLSSAVEKAYQQIHDFVEKNTLVQKDIKLKSGAVLQYMEEKMKQEWNSAIQNVNVVPKQNFVSLSGPKSYVEKTEACLKNMISRMHPDTIYIDKPGAKQFFLENEEMYITTVWNKHECLMQLEKEPIDKITYLGEPHCQISLQNGATLFLYKGDPFQHSADVIIISSNKDLKPIGGLALALVRAAGPSLQKEWEKFVQKEGELEPGECVITDGGNLQFKKVIHAFGPTWDKKGNSKFDRLLRKVITQSLGTAAANGQSSVAISVGDFVTSGCPLELCAQNIVKSIKSFTESQGGPNAIKSIHLMDSDDGIIKTTAQYLTEEFEEKNVQFTLKQGMIKQKKKSPKKAGGINKGNDQMVTTKEGLNINIKQGNIEDAITDVIVNSVGTELSLRTGAVAKALSRKAGNDLQELLNKEKRGRQVENGSTFVTDGCKLSCDTVIHAVVPEWDGPNGTSEKILMTIMRDCLSTTEEKQCRSITIPAMGTGILGFPKNTVATIMFEEILEFSSRNRLRYLKQVDFMLHPSDADTIKAFTTELEKKTRNGAQKKEDKPQSFFGNVKNPAKDVYEMRIGSLTYQVKTGDITKEKCDVIINSSNTTFDFNAGVSKAIMERAGPEIKKECALLAIQPNDGYVVTQGGNLPCKNIIHISGNFTIKSIGQSITSALQVCERQRATSVAFPAIGTGTAGVSSSAVADTFLDAVVDFAKSKSAQTVQNVMVVVFQQPMLKDFKDSMKKKEPPPAKQQSWFSSITSAFMGLIHSKTTDDTKEEEEEEEEPNVFELRENIEPAIIHLCAESRESVKETSQWLQTLITKDQHDNTITDNWIQHLDPDILGQLQKKNGVSISVDTQQSTIKVAGRTKDVLEVSNKIQEMIKNVRDKKTREQEAELCSNVVEWGYYRGSNFVPFDKMTNLELEKAKNDEASSVNIDIGGVKYTVIMELKSANDSKGNSIKLQRHPKNAESFVTPPYWEAMDNTELKVVSLNSGSSEYSEVRTLFQQTCQMRIIKIERIQNKSLYQNYKIKKHSIDSKNGTKTNELRLFHGTDIGTTDNINRHGFNRAYAGSNAAKLGKGTYFATEANYSAEDTYSKPDTNGYKYMYLARVLTGVYCVGNKEMIAPPAKSSSNPTDLYDSVTDNTSRPSVFVIFNDVQAYPGYLITFTK